MAIKRNEALIQAATWMKLKNNAERSLTQGHRYNSMDRKYPELANP